MCLLEKVWSPAEKKTFQQNFLGPRISEPFCTVLKMFFLFFRTALTLNLHSWVWSVISSCPPWKNKIRCNPIGVPIPESKPTTVLYHGTCTFNGEYLYFQDVLLKIWHHFVSTTPHGQSEKKYFFFREGGVPWSRAPLPSVLKSQNAK